MSLLKTIQKLFVQFISRKILQFYKGYFINFYQMKALEIEEFENFVENFRILVRILRIFN